MRSTAAADQASVRRHNLGLVLRQVAERGGRSRARLAVETGLTKATVSSLVSELIELGLLRETGMAQVGGTGRPGRLLEVATDRVCALGLEISENYLAVLAVDLTGAVRYEQITQSANRSLTPQAAVGRLGQVASQAVIALAAESLTPAGATVALTGLVDSSRGMLFMSPNFGWREIPVAQLLHEGLGAPEFPIYIDNDANLAALAEAWLGAGRVVKDFLYVHGLVRALGVGSGIVINGGLYRGASGFGAELGHMTVDPGGRRCMCGNRGCLQLYVGQDALARRAGLSSSRSRDYEHSLTVLVRQAQAGDPRVLDALTETAHWLAEALCSAINLLNPSAVILGGYFAPLSQWLVPGLQAEIDERVFGARWSHCQVLASELGSDVSVRGAAALTLREVLANPATISDLRAVAS